MLYGDKEIKQFTKELNDFYSAKSKLRTKIIEYLDNLNEEIEICVNIDSEELVFVKISNQVLEQEDGFECDYRYLPTEELIEILEEIIKYHQEQKED